MAGRLDGAGDVGAGPANWFPTGATSQEEEPEELAKLARNPEVYARAKRVAREHAALVRGGHTKAPLKIFLNANGIDV